MHFILAYLLAVVWDWKMYGIAIASGVHFFVRFLISFGFARWSGKFDEGYVPLFDPENFKNWKP